MTELRKAAEMALEVFDGPVLKDATEHAMRLRKACDLLRQALAQPEQEPVAWNGACVLGHCGSPSGCETSNCCRADYTAPPKQSEQEPVAWMHILFDGRKYCVTKDESGFVDDFINTYTTIPLYTAPPKREWVGLKGDEISECWKTGDVVAAVEAKLKEKNGG